MTEPEPDDPKEHESVWHRRRPGIRYAYSVAAIVGGAALAVRYAITQGSSSSSSSSSGGGGSSSLWLLIGGLALLAFGVVSVFVYRSMDKRKL